MRLTRAGWDRSRLVPWPAGVNVDRFSPARRSSGLRDSWGVSDRRLAVLYVGQLSPQKGLARLAAVEGLLRQRQLGARLIVVGDSGMTRGFRDRCGDAVFMGRMPHDEVAIAMASADVLVCPSDRDTTGHVVLEAQASGLPVIVSRYGASREQMIDGETGFVCDADEPLDFGLRTAQLVSDPQRRRRMSFAARAYAQTRPWTRALEPLFECYREADRSVQDSRRAAWWRRLGLGLRVR
jgi:glycosyltransferase involved in cell wall biosynthesis